MSATTSQGRAPTAEQQAILTACQDTNDHLLVNARAGSGKTTTIMQAAPVLRGSSCLMAFNRAIADELKARASQLPFTAQALLNIGTVHALGLAAFRKGAADSKPRTNGGKLNFLLKDIMANRPKSQQDYYRPVQHIITRMVSGAKNSGFDLLSTAEPFPSSNDETAWLDLLAHYNWDTELEEARVAPADAIELAQLLLATSNNSQQLIDFDDMIYLPLLRNYPVPTYRNVLIDEAQDISATRRELAFRMLHPEGRIIAVGDEFQAIYGFTGADAQSLNNIARRAGQLGPVQHLPLTICWRCDSGIIDEARRLVPDIRPRPDASEGRVAAIPLEKIFQHLEGTAIPDLDTTLIPAPGDAILCRLNKPNVSMALALLRAGKRARIEGRDLGARLKQHVKSATKSYAFRTLQELIVDTEDWGTEQCNLLAAKGREAQAALLADEIGCSVLLLERAIERGQTDFAGFEMIVDDLFDDNIPPSGVITLSSVHKSKGREWPRVFLLGKGDYMPFWMATQDWELQQERNLIYVAQTRAEQQLCYITDVKSTLDKRSQ